MKQMKRITVYVPEDEYRQLRHKLLNLGKTFSGWIREVIIRFLAE